MGRENDPQILWLMPEAFMRSWVAEFEAIEFHFVVVGRKEKLPEAIYHAYEQDSQSLEFV